jgi:hypothetical protein
MGKGMMRGDKIYKSLPFKIQKAFSTSEEVMFINFN